MNNKKHLKTSIKAKTYYVIDSNDEDLREWECGHHLTFDHAIEEIAISKVLHSEKFRYVDFEDTDEYEYYNKVLKRFQRLLKYYLNPERKVV